SFSPLPASEPSGRPASANSRPSPAACPHPAALPIARVTRYESVLPPTGSGAAARAKKGAFLISAETATAEGFEAPGPGTWEIDDVHFPQPVTRYFAEVHPEPFARGFAEFARFYGMMFAGREYGYVNGFAYGHVAPLPEEEVPGRFQRAEEVFAQKLWREQLRDWDETFKPASIKTHQELQSVDLDALSDEELIAHLTRCRDHHAAMIYQHMRHTGAAILPVGDFVAHVGRWTQLPPAELLDLMRGAAPVSAGASGQLEDLTAAVAADPDARQLLESEEDP